MVSMFGSSPSISLHLLFNFVLLHYLLPCKSIIWLSFGIFHSSVLSSLLPSFPFQDMAYPPFPSWNLSFFHRLRTTLLFLSASELFLSFYHFFLWTSKYVLVSYNDYQNFTNYLWPFARSACTYLQRKLQEQSDMILIDMPFVLVEVYQLSNSNFEHACFSPSLTPVGEYGIFFSCNYSHFSFLIVHNI